MEDDLGWSSTTLAAGFSLGARTVLRPTLVVEMYGSRDFGKSNGFLQLYATIAKAAGPVGFGLLLGAVGWAWTWSMLATLLLTSSTLLFALRPIAQRGLVSTEALSPTNV